MALQDAAGEIDAAFTRKDPRGLSYENAFAGALSFLRRRYTKDLSCFELAITGIPFDQAVTNRPGARLGPRAIREASSLMTYDPPFGWESDPLTTRAIADAGDMAFDYADVASVPAAIEAHVSGLLEQGAGVIVLGGDHSVTLPVLRAHAKRHGPLALIQVDAHGDAWADDDPRRIDHGTFAWKAVKEGVIDATRSVQVGIRTRNPDPGDFTILSAPEVHRMGAGTAAARARDIVGDGPVYLTFDIDGLDPAFAPGTGTPVWGGLSTAQAAEFVRGLAGVGLVGGDVVEVSPPFDSGGITALAGAHVALELICLWDAAKRP